MLLTGDYHTHTIYSHGSGTVLDNALAAKEKGLKEIADGAFAGCSSLSAVRLPRSVTEIAVDAFRHCPKLTIEAPVGSAAAIFERKRRERIFR